MSMIAKQKRQMWHGHERTKFKASRGGSHFKRQLLTHYLYTDIALFKT